jgi:group I intron endonuclease
MFVYLITNTINGKRYVGQTTLSLEERWWQHCCKNSNCRHLASAIRKYGKENFIIESIVEPPTIDLMNEFEAEYIEKYCTRSPNGYNLTEGGRVPRHSEETRRKMSLSHLGKKNNYVQVFTEERKEKARLRMIGNKNTLGYRHSEESRKRISESQKVRWAKIKTQRDNSTQLVCNGDKNERQANQKDSRFSNT